MKNTIQDASLVDFPYKMIGNSIQKYFGTVDLTEFNDTIPWHCIACLDNINNHYNKDAITSLKILLLFNQIILDIISEVPIKENLTFKSFTPEAIGHEMAFSFYLPINETISACKSAIEYFTTESTLDNDTLMDIAKNLKGIQLAFSEIATMNIMLEKV